MIKEVITDKKTSKVSLVTDNGTITLSLKDKVSFKILESEITGTYCGFEKEGKIIKAILLNDNDSYWKVNLISKDIKEISIK